MIRSILATLAIASAAAFGLAACGSSTTALTRATVAPVPTAAPTFDTTTPAPTAAPIYSTPEPTAVPTAAPTAAPATSGYGDTSDNPDSTFACAFSASYGGVV